jgi:hypothetical protein
MLTLIRSLWDEFGQRFGIERIRDGLEFTSVGDDLALPAPLFFSRTAPANTETRGQGFVAVLGFASGENSVVKVALRPCASR